jgi:cell division protein FtsL
VRRISLTTWLVLGLCCLVGIVAIAMTVIVIVRLNRQVLASAAELRVGRAAGATADTPRGELVQYAASVGAIEQQWSQAVADFRVRYPDDAVYQSVATAQAVDAVNRLKRPAMVAPLHERWAQAWSDRDAALALLARPAASDADRSRAAELGRKADDELRRVRNELRDFLAGQGISDAEVATARAGG